MAAEQKRLTAADLLGKDLRAVHQVPWPGSENGRQVGVLELRCAEIQDAYFAAREHFSKRGWSDLDAVAISAFNIELEVQNCYRMLIDPDSRNAVDRIFKDADECRKRLGPAERHFFATMHDELQEKKVTSWSPNQEDGENA